MSIPCEPALMSRKRGWFVIFFFFYRVSGEHVFWCSWKKCREHALVGPGGFKGQKQGFPSKVEAKQSGSTKDREVSGSSSAKPRAWLVPWAGEQQLHHHTERWLSIRERDTCGEGRPRSQQPGTACELCYHHILPHCNKNEGGHSADSWQMCELTQTQKRAQLRTTDTACGRHRHKYLHPHNGCQYHGIKQLGLTTELTKAMERWLKILC